MPSSLSEMCISAPGFVQSTTGRCIAPPVQWQKNKCSRRRRQPLHITPFASSSSGEANLPPPKRTLKDVIVSVNNFTRPHTIRGTLIGTLVGCTRAIVAHRDAISWCLLPRALLGLVALLLGNAYIVGINQIYDVDVDKVNKPSLPLAAGELDKRTAWTLVVASLVAGLYIVRQHFSVIIFRLYAFGLFIGTLYSVPPFHLKRFPVAAALIIATVRGFLLNFGVYHATTAALGLPFRWEVPISFLTAFMTIFAVVIALGKDIPDIEGDRRYAVPTFAVRMGASRMLTAVTAILCADYAFAIATAVRYRHVLRTSVMISAHSALIIALTLRRRKVDDSSPESIRAFYSFIWTLFYSEYLLFLFI